MAIAIHLPLYKHFCHNLNFPAAQSKFVVLTDEHKYYFVPNLSRTIMAKHYDNRAMVTGEMHIQYTSIEADKLDLGQNGKWKTIQSLAMGGALVAWMGKLTTD